MGLYMDEIYFDASSVEHLKQRLELFLKTAKGSFPPGVTLKAGPWFSNEEFKEVVILEIEDHALTFDGFYKGMSTARIKRRRLTPLVDAQAIENLIAQLS